MPRSGKMDPDRSTNIELYKVFQTFSLSIAFLFVSRAIVSLKYIWSSKRYARIMSLTALRSEFNLENLQGDLGVCTLSTVGSMLIASKAATMAHSVNLTIVTFSWLFRQRRNNRAIGLAWGYYFGYLKKVLPRFSQAINRCKHKDDFLPKLFILMPTDCHIYHSLADIDKRLSFEENLDTHEENVAGVQGRRYIHSSYKINDPKFGTFYAAIEYATPLNVLRDMCRSKKAGFSTAERDHQCIIFYETIKDIVENNSKEDNARIKDNVAFVYLPRDANVVDEIIETIKQMPSSRH